MTLVGGNVSSAGIILKMNRWNPNEWIGRTHVADARLSPAPGQRLAVTLDVAIEAAVTGSPVPPLWHWAYFTPLAPTRDLGPDGHPPRGSGVNPPVDLPRRMFAAAEISFEGRIRFGEVAERRSEITAIERKEGRSGELVFVTIEHRVSSLSGSIEERHTLVYREPPDVAPSAIPPPPPRKPIPDDPWQHTVVPGPTMLFRYSAVTFNSHRIHYDHPYATRVEGYPDLVVQGPLVATLLAELCRRRQPDRRLRSFSFKSTAPLFCGRPIHLRGRPDGADVSLAAYDDRGTVATQASAVLA